MEFIAVIMAIGMFFGIARCTDRTHLERQVEKQANFEMNGAEFFCLKTEKQREIDRLRSEIAKVRTR